MKFLIDFEMLEIDARGELLRDLVFEQGRDKKGCYEQKGCYETFITKPEFKKINPKRHINLYCEFENWDGVQAYESPTIIAMWAWDGDGKLLIRFKNMDVAYINDDCKCSYGWREIVL